MLLRKLVPNRSEILTASLTFVAGSLLFALAPVAFAAQVDPGGAPTVIAGMSHGALEWFLFGTSLLGYAVRWVDPANTSTPWGWKGQSRVIAFTVLGALIGLAQYITKDPSTPWTESLITGAMTIVVPMLMHFSTLLSKGAPAAAAAKVGGAALLILGCGLLGASASGCGAAGGAQATTITNEITAGLAQACVDAAEIAPLLDPSLPAVDEAALKTICPQVAAWTDQAIDGLIANFTQANPVVAAKLAAQKRARQARGQW